MSSPLQIENIRLSVLIHKKLHAVLSYIEIRKQL
jgi:hypothetical protein